MTIIKSGLKWTTIACLALLLAGAASSASAYAAGDTIRAWGYNFYGELGNGHNSGPDSCGGTPCSMSPLPVGGVSGARAIAVGGFHSVALLQKGTVLSWGRNAEGQLGTGTTTEADRPTPVPGLVGVVAISAGDFHSLALLSNGTVMAWGDNRYGQLGNGTTTKSSVPIPVHGLSNVVAIAAGGWHNLALLANGTVMGWGINQAGELGIGTSTGPDTCGTSACSMTPVPISGLSGVVAVSAGIEDSHSQALLSGGTVMSWGDNLFGELGTGSGTGPSSCNLSVCSPSPVPATGISGVVAIAAGWNHSLARLANGSGMAWGGNANGQLGIGTSDGSSHPTPMPISGLSGLAAVAGADSFSLAVLSSGAVTAWGLNNEGQLGNGTTTASAQPGAVTGLSSGTAVAGGFNHSLALVGPSQALTVSLAGAGAGAVGAEGILCPLSCSERYPPGATVILRAQPAAGVRFAGFSGACSGTGTCVVAMGQDQSVTATFGPPKGTKIKKATINRRKHSAAFSFTAPGAITRFQCALVRLERGRHHRRHQPHFAKCGRLKRYPHLRPGRYLFEVRALDVVGPDPTPASKTFTV